MRKREVKLNMHGAPKKRPMTSKRSVKAWVAPSQLRDRVRAMGVYFLKNFNPFVISQTFAIIFGIMPYRMRISTKVPEKNTTTKELSKVQKVLTFLKRLSLFGVITNIVWIYLYFFQILIRPLTIQGFKKKNQIMYKIGTGQPWNSWFALQNFTVNLFNGMNLFYVWWRFYPLPDLLERLNEIDRELVKEDVLSANSHFKLINCEWLIIGGANLVTILCYIFKLMNGRERYYSTDKSYSRLLILLQIFCYTKCAASISMFFALFTKLRLRHKNINQKLKLIFERVQQLPAIARLKTISGRFSIENEQKKKQKDMKEEIARTEYQLRRINQIYYELVVKQEEIMEMFKIDLLVGMAALSVGLGVDIFLILYKMMYSATPWRGLFSFWQAILIWNLYLTFNAGDYLYSEARETRIVLSRYNSSSFPDLIKTEIRCFLIRIKHKLPTISVYDMYDLSFSTVPSLVTGLASYVVILLQYEWIKDIDRDEKR